MKSIRLFALLGVMVSICAPFIVHALDLSKTLPVERYTILDDETLQYDVGNMLPSGKFNLISSMDMGLLGQPLSEFEPISGRIIMIEQEFDGYKADGVIPHWTRSTDDFPIGLEYYVIISVVGGPSPNPLATIQDQPESQSILEGQYAVFTVDASPEDYLSYQWYFGGKLLPDQTESTLFFEVDKAAQAGNYRVAINAGGKNVFSAWAALKVIIPVAVASNPKSETVKAGHGAVLRVTAKGTGPYTYQWYGNGSPISGATKSFYAIPHVTAADGGRYAVIVANQWSSVVSGAATLTVTP